jgi:uncharacterized protein (DUF2141 family)
MMPRLVLTGLPLLITTEGRVLATDPAPAHLNVEVLSFRNSNGTMGCSLYNRKDGFPTEPKKAIQTAFVGVHDGRAVCEFTGLPPGDYAVAVFHDENGNKHLDTGFFGIPKEGVGISNDATAFMGPPSFEKSMFKYPGGVFSVTLHMKYL